MERSDELVAKAVSLQPLLREHAARIDAERRLPDTVIDAVTEAGLFRLATPKRYGGHESGLRTTVDVLAALAEGDGSTAWVVGLIGACNWMTGLFPTRAQDEVYGEDPDSRVTGVLSPTATSRRTGEGWRVSGRWSYNSGSWHAQWALVGIPITDDGQNVVGQGLALMPRDDFDIEETWFVAGLRGTASNTLVAQDVLVPDHRVLSVPDAIEGRCPTEHGEEALYRSAFVPVLSLVLAGAPLGLARAALRYVMDRAATKPVTYTSYAAQADSPAVQAQIARAALGIDTAHLHLRRAAQDIDDAARQGRYPDRLARARARADTGWAVQHAVEAVNTLVTVYGAAAFADASPLQRMWRDVNVAGRHAFVVSAVTEELYGRALLGISENITPLI